MASISFRNVSKRYRGAGHVIDVLNDFNLEIAAGEFVALMGPSGSGKSTILNLAAGLDRADRGEIIVGGKHLEQMLRGRLAQWRGRHVAIVFQSYNLLPMLSAAGNVELPLLLKRLTRAERKQRVAAALEMVGLSDRADHKPGQLSGGQQQRVAIARAIIAEPSLLLCDEPTGDLDRDSADTILALLKSLNREKGMTIIMVTHDPGAAACAGRTLRLEKKNTMIAA